MLREGCLLLALMHVAWIHLGHGNNQELLSLVRSGIT